MAQTLLEIPQQLKPADGRFGSGPSRLRAGQLPHLAGEGGHRHAIVPALIHRQSLDQRVQPGHGRGVGSGQRMVPHPLALTGSTVRDIDGDSGGVLAAGNELDIGGVAAGVDALRCGGRTAVDPSGAGSVRHRDAGFG